MNKYRIYFKNAKDNMIRWPNGYNFENDNVDDAEIRFYHPKKEWQVIQWRGNDCVVMYSSQERGKCDSFIEHKKWKQKCFDNSPIPTHCPFCDTNYYVDDKCPVCGE